MALRSSDPRQALASFKPSVDLVDSAKQLVSKPEYRIQLDALFEKETDRLCNELNGAEFSLESDWDQQKFTARIEFYKQETEQLAKMAGVLGRWGDGSELPLVLDVIRTLYSQAKTVTSGVSGRPDIRSYPAVLIFTAYGIGLTRAQRWESFHGLCSAEIAREHQKPARLIEKLFLWDWEGNEDRLWKQLEGLDKCSTPLSDHFHNVFSTWGKSFIGLTPDYEILYERFEVMGSLAHRSSTPEDGLRAILNSNGPFVDKDLRIPIGRTGWNSSTHSRIFQELQSVQTKKALVKAGFVESESYINLFVKNFDHVANIRLRHYQ